MLPELQADSFRKLVQNRSDVVFSKVKGLRSVASELLNKILSNGIGEVTACISIEKEAAAVPIEY